MSNPGTLESLTSLLSRVIKLPSDILVSGTYLKGNSNFFSVQERTEKVDVKRASYSIGIEKSLFQYFDSFKNVPYLLPLLTN